MKTLYNNITASALVIIRARNTCKTFCFTSETAAKNFMVEKYRKQIKLAPFYDYENSYISKDLTYAQINTGKFNIQMMMCTDILNGQNYDL